MPYTTGHAPSPPVRPVCDTNAKLLLDKPLGLSSNDALQKAKWLLRAEKAGHTGTLDPAATGVLAVALGEATKTVPYVTDALKAYEFSVRLGLATNTDDAEGEVIAQSDTRPSDAEIEALANGLSKDRAVTG